MNFELINDSINYKHVFYLHDKVQGVDFTDLIEVVTLELPKLPKTDSADSALPWLEFIRAEGKEETLTIVEKYPHLKEAYNKLQEMSISRDDIFEYNLRLRAYYDEVSALNEKERILTELEQHKSELEQHKSELEQHKSELRQKTNELKESKFETAKKALEANIDIQTIAKITGLTESEIENLIE